MPPTNQQDAELIEALSGLEIGLAMDGRPIAASSIHDAIARIQSQPQGEGWVKLHGGMKFPVWATDGHTVKFFQENCRYFDQIYTHYKPAHVPAPPPAEPTPEEIQAQEDEKAFEAKLEQYRKRCGWAASEVKEFWNAALEYDRERASARRATT